MVGEHTVNTIRDFLNLHTNLYAKSQRVHVAEGTESSESPWKNLTVLRCVMFALRPPLTIQPGVGSLCMIDEYVGLSFV